MSGDESEYLDANYLNGGEVFYVNSPRDVEEDDVIILWDGSQAGTVYYGFKGALGSTLKAYKAKESGSFLYQFLKRNQQRIYNNYRTPNIPHVIKTFADEFDIGVPSFEEQVQIGAFFAQLDNLITLLHRKCFTENFTFFGRHCSEIPVLANIIHNIHEFAHPWVQRKLGDLMDITSVKRIHQSDWTSSGIRFLRARDIVSASKNQISNDLLYISEEKYNEYSLMSGKVAKGDLLVTGVGTIGVPMLITDDNPVYFKDGNIIWFINGKKIDGDFFYYSFTNYKIQKYIQSVAGIGTVGTYTIDSGKKTPISLPEKEEQEKIGQFFKQLDATIVLHQRE